VLSLMMMLFIVVRTALPPELQHAVDYTLGLQQMANYPLNTRRIVNIGKWNEFFFMKACVWEPQSSVSGY